MLQLPAKRNEQMVLQEAVIPEIIIVQLPSPRPPPALSYERK